MKILPVLFQRQRVRTTGGRSVYLCLWLVCMRNLNADLYFLSVVWSLHIFAKISWISKSSIVYVWSNHLQSLCLAQRLFRVMFPAGLTSLSTGLVNLFIFSPLQLSAMTLGSRYTVYTYTQMWACILITCAHTGAQINGVSSPFFSSLLSRWRPLSVLAFQRLVYPSALLCSSSVLQPWMAALLRFVWRECRKERE